MQFDGPRHIGDVLKERTIILKGADAASAKGFTQVPNFLLKSKHLSAGDKMTFAMLLSYAWQNDYCFPGQQRLGDDLGLDERSVRRHLKSLQANGLLAIQRRGQGKTNIYELNLKPKALLSRSRPDKFVRSRPAEIVRSRPDTNSRSSINDTHLMRPIENTQLQEGIL
jgi:DNA-binding transcriptional ArsR family regulator